VERARRHEAADRGEMRIGHIAVNRVSIEWWGMIQMVMKGMLRDWHLLSSDHVLVDRSA
jgi:hypothetical protein